MVRNIGMKDIKENYETIIPSIVDGNVRVQFKLDFIVFGTIIVGEDFQSLLSKRMFRFVKLQEHDTYNPKRDLVSKVYSIGEVMAITTYN